MAAMFISWEEIRNGDFPDVCMTCGCDRVELVPRVIQTVSLRFGYSVRRWVTVNLPFCPAHHTPPYFSWGRTDASKFTDDGVWMKNLSPDFVDAMEEHREKMARRQRRIKRTLRELEEELEEHSSKSSKTERRPRPAAKRPAEADDEDDRPSPRRSPSRQRSTGWLVPTLVTLGTIFLLFMMCGSIVTFMILPRLRIQVNQGAPQGPAVAPHPFDPVGPPFGPVGGPPFGPPGGPPFGPEPFGPHRPRR